MPTIQERATEALVGLCARRGFTSSGDKARVVLDAAASAVATWCDWSNPDIDTPGSHEQWHFGFPCPYETVVPALLRGEPDPRRVRS